MSIEFGRDICGDLASAEGREWLVTNGIGGYASGTVAGLLTRRYHGLLVAALQPPLGRTLLLAKLDETAIYDGKCYPFFTNRWADGSVDPHGYRHLEQFWLEGSIPVWRFACADALIEKRLWMVPNENTTCIEYRLLGGILPVSLSFNALVNYRDHHGQTRAGNWQMQADPVAGGLGILAYPGARPFYLFSNQGSFQVADPQWYRQFGLALERYRGLGDREDHLRIATLNVTLDPGCPLLVTASLRSDPSLADALARRQAHERDLLARFSHNAAPKWIEQLALAADQFIVSRPLIDRPEGKTILAGYHWFSDWGRDTMISLPGLTLSTGRPEIARSILSTFAHYVDRGMLPNRFPDLGQDPEYNTVDATLWYFVAIWAYWRATQDGALIHELFPTLVEILDWHRRGTRYDIHQDPADGLLYAGEPGVQLTWMDAKLGDWVVTPRIGKPVEINALWIQALRVMAALAEQLGKPAQDYRLWAEQASAGFRRFWDPDLGYCYDVLDGLAGNDPALRPNQILAVSVPDRPLLDLAQQRAVVDVCARHLVTSHGLRSLAPTDSHYQGRYGGDPLQRDGAYHQGTAWGWLLGSFALAHLKAYGDPDLAQRWLQPMAHHLRAQGVGSLGEIADGDPPFAPRGCIAQAWTVAEVLRAWIAIDYYRGSQA